MPCLLPWEYKKHRRIGRLTNQKFIMSDNGQFKLGIEISAEELCIFLLDNTVPSFRPTILKELFELVNKSKIGEVVSLLGLEGRADNIDYLTTPAFTNKDFDLIKAYDIGAMENGMYFYYQEDLDGMKPTSQCLNVLSKILEVCFPEQLEPFVFCCTTKCLIEGLSYKP